MDHTIGDGAMLRGARNKPARAAAAAAAAAVRLSECVRG